MLYLCKNINIRIQLLMKFHLFMPTEHNTRSITQMMHMNWNVTISSRNRKHVSFSEMTYDEIHEEHIDHDSKHDKTVASLLAQLDDVDSKLHDECVITVRDFVLPERCPGNFFVSFNAVVSG